MVEQFVNDKLEIERKEVLMENFTVLYQNQRGGTGLWFTSTK